MRPINPLALVLIAGLFVVTPCGGADEPKAEAAPENPLIGTWKLISAKYGGTESELPEGTSMLKHITPAQFMWVTYDKDGLITRAAGGTYSIKGENYEETPEYGISESFERVKGQTHSFKWKIEGNKWYHNGALATGLTIEEVWERVEKK